MATRMKTTDVRRLFIEFFEKQPTAPHLFVPSMPVIPYGDPTLLFTNSGMVQFKEIFQGRVAPGSAIAKIRDAKRVANSQACIRAGGKHNDLDDVGKDTYHHTGFEMLGNWSFGDYFKKEAIDWAWKLLTEVYKLPADRLYASYFGGEPGMDVPEDVEAKNIWLQYLPADRIMPFGKKENFWEMGDKGPCGPCSEIHFDRIGGRHASHLVNMDDPNVLEIWNLVFMQYNREEDASLTLLPAPCVDTGMGLERVASVINDVRSNYDIDIWDPIFAAIQRETGFPTPYPRGCGTGEVDMAYRVVADHIRTTTFAIADGCAPGTEGRSYVVRRIIRRAIRYGKETLKATNVGWFSNLVDSVSEAMGDYFTNLRNPKTVAFVKRALKAEEELFNRTWDAGVREYSKAKGNLVNNTISGKTAFLLHSAYGFPFDLQQIMADADKIKIDEQGYKTEWEEHVNKSRGKMSAKQLLLNPEQCKSLESDKIVLTEDKHKYVWENIDTNCRAIFDFNEKKFVTTLSGTNIPVGIVLDRTNFYYESGGQVGDRGMLKKEGAEIAVEDTQNYAGYVIHKGILDGSVTVGDPLEAIVDFEIREKVASNHTSTHVLNHALREVLVRRTKSEDAVEQQGSFVDEETLRFDFSYPKKLTHEQIEEVQKIVQKAIDEKHEVSSLEIPKDEALKINSIRSVFGEKYPDIVRVVCVGAKLDDILKNPTSDEWWKYSIEFCGGTHLPNMERASVATVIKEESLGGNTRRMTLYTHDTAHAALRKADDLEAELDLILTRSDDSIDGKLNAISKFGSDLEKAVIPILRKQQINEKKDKGWQAWNEKKKAHEAEGKVWGKGVAEQLIAKAKENPFVVELIRTSHNPKSVVNEIKETANPLYIIIAGENENTGLVTAIVPEAAKGKMTASEWVVGSCGKGGGSPVRAQGGVQDVAKAIETAKQLAEAKYK